MFPAKGIDSDNLLLILLRILLADGIAIKQLILDIIRVKPFLALFLPSYGLFHHLHDYLLEVVVSD